MPEPKTKLIAGESFSIGQPYAEGHVLTAIEAKTLNQTRSENIGNNLRDVVKAAIAARDGGDAEAWPKLLAEVAKYDTEYTFSTPGAGGTRKLDPIEREALALAREYVKADLQKKGRTMKAVPEGMTEETWKEKLESVIETVAGNEDILKLAKKRVAEKQKVASAVGDLLA